jgi:hypothetical protein
VSETIGLFPEIQQAVFDDAASGLSGVGRSVAASGTGDFIVNWGQKTKKFLVSMNSHDWIDDMNFSGEGGG